MKRDQQHKQILKLHEAEKRMRGDDKETFAMLFKRDHDDEDLDSIALQQLHELYQRYVGTRSKDELEARWKTMTKK